MEDGKICNYIDISVPMDNGMSVWDGDPDFERKFFITIATEGCNVSTLKLGTHTGTHIDAPLHFIENGKSVEQIDFNKLIGSCIVIDVLDSQLISKKLIPSSIIPDNLPISVKKILLKTSNSQNPGKFNKESVALSLQAAKKLVEKKINLIGIDGLSIETFDGDGSVHREFLSNEIVILETIDLSKVQPGTYNLTCLPLKIVGSDGSPARAILTPI